MEEKNSMWCGIDVSKNDMAVAVDNDRELPVRKLPCRKFPRTLDGVQDMMEWCASYNGQKKDIHIFMESTGVYSQELLLWFHLHFPNIQVSVGNPRHIKHFIDSEHLGNKTDELDAKAIARMGTIQAPKSTPLPEPEFLQLQVLIRSRDELKTKMRSLEVSMKAMLEDKSSAYASFKSVVKVMAVELKKIEEAIADHVERMPKLKETVGRMCTMPGIGTISACTILAELGDFSAEHTRTEFSAYTGLQPSQKQSGTSVNSSHISKNGSTLLRKVLYLCSIHSIDKIPSLGAMYSRLLMRGKKPLTARCACMRKMLLILRSMVLNKHDFQDNYKTTSKIA